MELIGWIGSILLGGCAVPQAFSCIRQGHSNGLAHLFLWMWAIGEILTLIYILSFDKVSMPLVANYLINLTTLIVMIKYKYWPRKVKRTFPSMKDMLKHQYE